MKQLGNNFDANSANNQPENYRQPAVDPRSASAASGKNWLPATTTEQLVGHIHALRVRGAPLIGLSASLLLALQAEQGLSLPELRTSLEILRASRPTAVNLMNNLDRMKQALESQDPVTAMIQEALRLTEEDRQLCENIASAGSPLVSAGSRILTHCNTGGLATAGSGTALGGSPAPGNRAMLAMCGSAKLARYSKEDV